MRILSLDPGFTTGIAIYDSDGELEASMAVTRRGLFRNGFFNHLISVSKPDMTLIEALPPNNVSAEMRKIHSHITQWFSLASYQFELIRPAEWKGLVERVEIPGQHARDAATMGAWWIKNRMDKTENAGQNNRIKK